MQFLTGRKKTQFVWPFFLIMKNQNSWLCQIKAWAVLTFSWNKPAQIHLMFLYKEHFSIEKAFFLHHIHQCFSVCLLSQRLSPSCRWAAGEGEDSAPSLCSGRTPPPVLHPPLGAPAQESHGPVRAGLGEHHKHNHRVGAALQWKLPEMAGLFHPGEKKAPGRPHWAFQYLQERRREFFTQVDNDRTRGSGYKEKRRDSH